MAENFDSTSLDLPTLCYRTAYFALPQLLFSQPQRVLGYFTDNQYPAGPFIYAMAARMLGAELVREHALSFEAHGSELSLTQRVYVLQYPAPVPFELGQKGAILAPFFSAIVHDATDESVAYYVLGQSPLNATTFRTVRPDGANANLGPGPSPQLEVFIEFLRQKTGAAPE